MTTSIKDLEELKARAEQMRQASDRAQGALEQATAQLKEKFGVSTVEAAGKLLKEKEAAEEAAKTAFETKLEEFEEKWKDKLDVS